MAASIKIASETNAALRTLAFRLSAETGGERVTIERVILALMTLGAEPGNAARILHIIKENR
jgi:hypothetical protein